MSWVPYPRARRRSAISRCSHQLVRVPLCRASTTPPTPPSASTSAATASIHTTPASPPMARPEPEGWTACDAAARLARAGDFAVAGPRVSTTWGWMTMRGPRDRVMPLPNSWPLPGPVELPPPRACANGIAYSFATGLPGSIWTPDPGPEAATATGARTAARTQPSGIAGSRTPTRRANAPHRHVRERRGPVSGLNCIIPIRNVHNPFTLYQASATRRRRRGPRSSWPACRGEPAHVP